MLMLMLINVWGSSVFMLKTDLIRYSFILSSPLLLCGPAICVAAAQRRVSQ